MNQFHFKGFEPDEYDAIRESSQTHDFYQMAVKRKPKGEINMNNRITLWKEAFHPLDFRREFDRLFDDWLSPVTQGLRTDSHFVPVCDVEDQDDHYLLSLELAGIKKEDIRIEAMGNQIIISGERTNETRKKEDRQTYSERRFGKFQRTFALPVGVDSS